MVPREFLGDEQLVAGDAPPLDTVAPYYVLVEALGSDPDKDARQFEQAISAALEQGLLTDALLCQSGRERDALWAMRDDVEKTLQFGPALVFDVSLTLSCMEDYIKEVLANLDKICPGHRTWVFGHAGDGNLHLVCAADDLSGIEQAVYEPLQAAGGSISGEHGIELEKKRWLTVSRSQVEIELMQRLKTTFDPQGILNPGRVFDVPVAGGH